jgi:hypothetical protein
LYLAYSLRVASRNASGGDIASENGFRLVGVRSVNRCHEGSRGLREALVLAFGLSCRVVKELRAIPASTRVSPPHHSAAFWPGGFRLRANRPAPRFAVPFRKGWRVGTFATSASSAHPSECSVWGTTPPPPTNRIAAVGPTDHPTHRDDVRLRHLRPIGLRLFRSWALAQPGQDVLRATSDQSDCGCSVPGPKGRTAKVRQSPTPATEEGWARRPRSSLTQGAVQQPVPGHRGRMGATAEGRPANHPPHTEREIARPPPADRRGTHSDHRGLAAILSVGQG